MEARLVCGHPHVAKHTATGALAAGEVIAIGQRAAVVHPCPIPANSEGSVAIFGGEWELEKDDTSGPAIDIGEEVAWITGSDLATDVITSNLHFGFCTVAGGASDAHVIAFLNPKGGTTNPTS